MVKNISFILQLALVGSGGLLGSLTRFLVARGFLGVFGASRFPWPTFLVNLIGCAFLGVITGWLRDRHLVSPWASAILLFGGIGFCGGLTTFSTWIYELVTFGKQLDVIQLAAYFLLSMALGILLFLSAYRWAGSW